MTAIDTERFSRHLRERSVRLAERRLLVSRLAGSEQEGDLSVPPNCGGFGRVRHFRRTSPSGWPGNPLPIDPAAAALGIPPGDLLRAQVFQNAACNWRCWYCFVPFRLLDAREDAGGWFTAEELLDMYVAEPDDRPRVIDLTGGQPDLVPEWVPWMMRAIRARGIEKEVYLWSDDNLSNDFFWRFLSDQDIELVAQFPGYGRVACFKGFDETSFSFNTRAAPALFAAQFDLFRRTLTLGIDLYAYATFTTPDARGVRDSMRRFVDTLQGVHPMLPLRTVPLEIAVFGVVKQRLSKMKLTTSEVGVVDGQWRAIEAWQRELDARFTSAQRAANIVHVPMR
jgi:uncharacterized Fe-S cluster-containing radical SAM superfamily protein